MTPRPLHCCRRSSGCCFSSKYSGASAAAKQIDSPCKVTPKLNNDARFPRNECWFKGKLYRNAPLDHRKRHYDTLATSRTGVTNSGKQKTDRFLFFGEKFAGSFSIGVAKPDQQHRDGGSVSRNAETRDRRCLSGRNKCKDIHGTSRSVPASSSCERLMLPSIRSRSGCKPHHRDLPVSSNRNEAGVCCLNPCRSNLTIMVYRCPNAISFARKLNSQPAMCDQTNTKRLWCLSGDSFRAEGAAS